MREKAIVGDNMGMPVADQKIRIKPSMANERYTLDPDDASRLSYLAYLVKNYTNELPASTFNNLVRDLNSREAKQTAKVILGKTTKKSGPDVEMA
jgi:hypothetical protein